MTFLVTECARPFGHKTKKPSKCPVAPPWLLIVSSCFNHSAMDLCFLERSDGGDGHLGTAHSNTAQGRFAVLNGPDCFARLRLFPSPQCKKIM